MEGSFNSGVEMGGKKDIQINDTSINTPEKNEEGNLIRFFSPFLFFCFIGIGTFIRAHNRLHNRFGHQCERRGEKKKTIKRRAIENDVKKRFITFGPGGLFAFFKQFFLVLCWDVK